MRRPFRPPRPILRLLTKLNILAYRMSAGRLANSQNGLPVLLLTTIGRKSGKQHTIALVYLMDGEHYVIMPGVYERPSWYLNLRASPQATVQVGSKQFDVIAVQTEGETRARLWATVPQYWHGYQAQYTDPLPLILLQRTS